MFGMTVLGALFRGADRVVDIVGGPAALTHGFLTAASKGLTLWDLVLYALIGVMASAAVLFGVLLWRDGVPSGDDAP
jgi:hypothetical protein